MADYISRDNAAKVLCMACGNAACDPFECSFYKEMEDVPAADVRPVVRGDWIEEDGVQICSECGEEHEWIDYRADFCDCCGADMREVL